jgi:hypothetical protein
MILQGLLIWDLVLGFERPENPALFYTAAMACSELQRLRVEATAIKNQMEEQRRRARAQAGAEREGRPSGRSEYLPLLQRKLERIAARIERHIATHQCQE